MHNRAYLLSLPKQTKYTNKLLSHVLFTTLYCGISIQLIYQLSFMMCSRFEILQDCNTQLSPLPILRSVFKLNKQLAAGD